MVSHSLHAALAANIICTALGTKAYAMHAVGASAR
jgi:hypothetical protein